jgi:NAD(P)-dependent dehydrogenase (short-subunit alcohol dehydrogenase family)
MANTRHITLPRTPSFRLDGKRALVTGAGRGIGLGCAAALAEAGAAVSMCARSKSELLRSADAICEAGGTAEAVVLDVCDTPRMRETLGALPPFDILVNNAGRNRPKPFVEVTIDDYDDVLELNLKAAFFVAQTVAEGMISAGRRGSIIHMSSQMGHVGALNRTLYCASKWGLEGMSKSMALDLAPHQIRVNTICPTFIETTLTHAFLEDLTFRDEVLSKIKLGRLGQIEDLLGAVVFLASDASAMMTGSAMVIDGGWTAD